MRSKTGTIDIDVFYNLVHEPPTVFADHLFELIDTDQVRVPTAARLVSPAV